MSGELGIIYAPPCEMCGAIYLNGSKTVCNRCGRIKEHGKVRMDTRIRFRCDCGAMAVNVILVEVGAEGEHQEVRLAVCEVCLEEERRTMRLLRERK